MGCSSSCEWCGMALERLGPYRIDRQIGKGGMGAVYTAFHEATQARVALKVLAPALAADEAFRQRFAGEIESLIRLRHPNIVEIFAYGEQDGNLFYAMELVEGRSLHEEQQSGRKFTWQEVVRLAIDICRALKHAHDHGVVHRDLKPANLLLDQKGVVKLTDFGIAKMFGGSHLTSEGGVIGTADYMAPEQAEGKSTTPRTDLYSLGGVLFALLTGRPPFVARSLPEVLHQLRYDDPPSLRRLAPDAPEELELIVSELLDKDPQNRIPTAMVLGRRLEAMLRALSASPPPADSPTQVGGSPHTLSGRREDADFSLSDQPTRVSQPEPTGNVPPDRSQNGDPPAGLPADHADEYRLEDASPTRQEMPRTSAPSAQATQGPPPVRSEGGAGGKADGGDPSSEATRQMRFTVVDEKERRRAGRLDSDDESTPLWLRLAGLAMVLLAGGAVLMFAFSSPSADRLYGRLHEAAQADDPERLLAVESDLERFIELYPEDPRCEELRLYQQEIELARLQRRFDRRVRRSDSGESLSAVEQAYLEARALQATNPEAGLAKMQALVDLYGDALGASESSRRCVELARRQLARGREAQVAAQEARLTELKARLHEADLVESSAPARAAAIYGGLIELYGDKPWAGAIVTQARTRLAALRASSLPEAAASKNR